MQLLTCTVFVFEITELTCVMKHVKTCDFVIKLLTAFIQQDKKSIYFFQEVR